MVDDVLLDVRHSDGNVWLQAHVHPVHIRYGDVVLDGKVYGYEHALPGLVKDTFRLSYQARKRVRGGVGSYQKEKAATLFPELEEKVRTELLDQGWIRVGYMSAYDESGWLWKKYPAWKGQTHIHTEGEIENFLQFLYDGAKNEEEKETAGSLRSVSKVFPHSFYDQVVRFEYGEHFRSFQDINDEMYLALRGDVAVKKAMIGQVLLYCAPVCLSLWCEKHAERFTVAEKYFLRPSAARFLIEKGEPTNV